MPRARVGIAGRIARAFIDSKLTPLIVIASVLLGVAAIVLLPREEEPQIKVPMIDVLVDMPGFSAKEVEERATRPMEKLLWEIPGVEYIYSTSRDGESLVIVRFKVGSNIDAQPGATHRKAALELRPHPPRRLLAADQAEVHRRRADPGAHLPQRALRSSHAAPPRGGSGRRRESGAARRGDDDHRRRAAPSARAARSGAAGLAQSQRGRPRADAPAGQPAISLRRPHRRTTRRSSSKPARFLTSAEDVGNVVIGVFGGRPVYLREVAEIVDGAEEPSNYVFFGDGAARRRSAR